MGKRHRDWVAAVERFLASGRQVYTMTCSRKATAGQTAWRLRARYGNIIDIRSDGPCVVFRRKVR